MLPEFEREIMRERVKAKSNIESLEKRPKQERTNTQDDAGQSLPDPQDA